MVEKLASDIPAGQMHSSQTDMWKRSLREKMRPLQPWHYPGNGITISLRSGWILLSPATEKIEINLWK
jgi:hypothetical protein